MLGLALVRPLEDDWRDTLDAVARRRRWPTSGDVAALGARVAELSAAYNDASVARAGIRDAGAARLGFAFARDVPKGAAAVRELVATRVLRLEGGRLRVLDVGAGLGAMTWGLVRALEAAGERGEVQATWLDPDADALDLASEIVRERAARSPGFDRDATGGACAVSAAGASGRDGIALRVTRVVRPVGSISALHDLGRFDVVLVGHALSELDVGAVAEARVDRHSDLLGALLAQCVDAHGALVVVEPALRDRTRHLHRVRDVLAAAGATVFAPCLHAAPCPALARESDWCHEDIPVDLPPWLVPVARAAALRRQGLTFSYLVLRNDGVRLATVLTRRSGAARLRVVSELMRSKGKRDAFLCGELPAPGDGAPGAARVRATRLDRDASDVNAAWAQLTRGDVLVVDPAPSLQRPRIGALTRVSRLDDTESR